MNRPDTLTLVITASGTLCTLYDESLDFGSFGDVAIRRASHVEPDAQGQWHADLAPVGGPTLGPFPKRSDALDAERAWLHDHLHTYKESVWTAR